MKLTAAVLALMLAGCAARGPDRTRGIALEVDVRDAGAFAALYRLKRDGTLGWGGGDSAIKGETTWEGALSDEEIHGLAAILEEDGWLGAAPGHAQPPAESASKRRTTVRVDAPAGKHRFERHGHDPAAERLVQHLDGLARRRYDGFLRALPKPDPPPAEPPADVPPPQGEPAPQEPE
jgi:hypothetical protein